MVIKDIVPNGTIIESGRWTPVRESIVDESAKVMYDLALAFLEKHLSGNCEVFRTWWNPDPKTDLWNLVEVNFYYYHEGKKRRGNVEFEYKGGFVNGQFEWLLPKPRFVKYL